jgi:flavodoxin
MAKILVVCFSGGGTTLHLAMDIAQALNADMEQIEEATPRSGALGYVRSVIEAVAKGIPTVRTRRDPRDYDLVILGTPVWAGTMASPVRSYLVQNRDRLPQLAFFATMGGHGAEQVLSELQTFCSAPDAPTLFATAHQVIRNDYRDELASFVDQLKERAPLAAAEAQRRVA